MAPTTGNALLILVLFVLPGFVALLVGERTHLVRVHDRSAFELLLIATYYSVLCWGIILLASWPFGVDRAEVKRWWQDGSFGKLAGVGLLAIIVAPTGVAEVARRWKRSQTWRPRVLGWLNVNAGHAVPTAWDELFRRRRPALVRAVLSDGRVVGGYYGSRSFSGYGQESQDLLLEQRWALGENHWFVEPVEGSHGLWLSAGGIVSLELYDPVYERPPEETGGDAASPQGAGGSRGAEAGSEAGQSSA